LNPGALKWSDLAKAKIKRIKIPNDVSKFDYYNLKFVLSIVNSKLISFYFNKTMRSGLHTLPNNVKNLLIPKISDNAQKPFINIIDKILQGKEKGKDTYNLETQIDWMVYELYGLTDEEIRLVEESVGGK